MKGLMLVLVPILILAIGLGSVACGGGETPGQTPTPTPEGGTTTPIAATPTPEATPPARDSIEDAIEAFEKLPVEWQRARYIDLAAFREDSTLTAFYEDCRAAVAQGLAATGIDLADVDHVCFVGGKAAVYGGRVDLDHVRQALEGMDYEQTTYLDAEIWESSDQEMHVVTLLQPDTVLVTHELEEAELCISVVGGWGRSLYDDDDVREVVARLPRQAFRVDVTRGDASGLLATGRTMDKIDGQTLGMMMLGEFRDDASAEAGIPQVAGEFDAWARVYKMEDVETVQIRRFVKSTGSANIEDMENPLAHWTYWLH